jgi:two-component system cell cycle sensor histidine kinase/response regulator CckA
MRCLGQGETFQREVESGLIGSAQPRRVILTHAPAPPDVVLVHADDITDRRRLEEQLRQAQKMEAIGRLAGGVAHDFNNLLSVVLSYTGLALEELAPGDPVRDDLQQVKHAGERAVELTRQLLAFSRQQVLQPRGMSVREAVLGLEKMLRRLLGAQIELVLDLAARGQVEADPGQIEQVIMNLVINARDATPAGGTITLSTHDVEPSQQLLVEPPAAAKGPMTCLTVADTGSGMSEATRAQIFEPFFTTKGAGKGTGLGLATVFGIVEQSGGSICVQSRERDESGEESGTSFRIYLPRVKVSEKMASVAPKAGLARGGTETILVVEDEAPLRAVAVTVLRRAGYDVLEATDGADAVEVAARCLLPIHLLVTDVVMPRMNGRVLSDRLGAERPDMKVLFMSGYTDDAVVIRRVIASHVAFLQKPLNPATLLSKVRETLDGTGDAPRSSGRGA